MARTACVSFTDPKRGTYTHVTGGDTLFEAVSRAMNWFADPYWRGPRPRPDTVFEATLVGDEWPPPPPHQKSAAKRTPKKGERTERLSKPASRKERAR